MQIKHRWYPDRILYDAPDATILRKAVMLALKHGQVRYPRAQSAQLSPPSAHPPSCTRRHSCQGTLHGPCCAGTGLNKVAAPGGETRRRQKDQEP